MGSKVCNMHLKPQPHSAWTSWLLSNQMRCGWNARYAYNNSAPLLWCPRRATSHLPAGCSSAVRPAVRPTAGGLRLWRVGPLRLGGLEEPAWHQLRWQCEIRSHTWDLLRQPLKRKTKTDMMELLRHVVFCRMMRTGGSSGRKTSGWLMTTTTDFSWAWGRLQWLWTNMETWWVFHFQSSQHEVHLKSLELPLKGNLQHICLYRGGYIVRNI